VFDVEDAGEMDHNPRKNVLWRRREPATAEHVVLDAAIGKLKAARDRRRAPAVDTTAYVSWNAMMAGAFLHAGAVLDRRECNTLALAVLERIWNEAWREQSGMAHVLGRDEPRGMLDDNVQSAAAFLDAYEATGDARWLDRSARVMAWRRSRSPASGRSPIRRNGGISSTASTPHSPGPPATWPCTARRCCAPWIGRCIPSPGSRCRDPPGRGPRATCTSKRCGRTGRARSWCAASPSVRPRPSASGPPARSPSPGATRSQSCCDEAARAGAHRADGGRDRVR